MKLIKIGKLERVYEFKKIVRKGLLIRKRKKKYKGLVSMRVFFF